MRGLGSDHLTGVERGVASNSEHFPVFRAQRKGEGHSAPVHGRGTLRPGPCKKIVWEGDTQHTNRQTSRLLD